MPLDGATAVVVLKRTTTKRLFPLPPDTVRSAELIVVLTDGTRNEHQQKQAQQAYCQPVEEEAGAASKSLGYTRCKCIHIGYYLIFTHASYNFYIKNNEKI